MSDEDTPAPFISTSQSVQLNLQNAMPVISQSRSRELIYDALQGNPRFVLNPYGPTWLTLSRPANKWT